MATVSLDLQERTLKVFNYGKNVTKSILNELFSQGGPVKNIVHKPGFSFIEFEDAESVSYCLAIFDGVELFGDRIQLAPKIPDDKAFHYFNILKQYEEMFIKSPMNWWNRFGDPSKPCPKHICSYTPFYRAPNTNYDYLMQNQMMNSPMNQQMNPQMNPQMLNQMMINNQMPTSSNYIDSGSYRQDRRYQREHEIARNRSFNNFPRGRDDRRDDRRNDRNNNKSSKASKRPHDDDHLNSKRTKKYQSV